MSDFGGSRRRPVSATDAAFIGFTLARREPLAFVGWALAYLLLAAANLAVQVSFILPSMTAFTQAQANRAATGAAIDPSTMFAGMGEIWRGNLIIIALSLVFAAVINAAVYRALMRPKERAFAYLRLGLDELRQFVTMLVLWLVMFGVYIASFIGGVIVAVIVGVAKVGGGGGAAQVTMILAIVACFLLPLLVVGVKLSFAGAMTFAERRVTLFGSWRATGGRFWTLLGVYVLAFFVLLVAGLIFAVLVMAVGFAVGGGMGGLANLRSFRGLGGPDAMRAMMFSPMMITWTVLGAPLGALVMATLAGIPAYIYAEGSARPEVPGADRSHAFGSPSQPDPPQGEFPITLARPTPPQDEL